MNERLPKKICNYIKSLNFENTDLISEISFLFDLKHPLVTHIGIFDQGESPSQDILFFDKDELAEKECVLSGNYLSSENFKNMYKPKKINVKRQIKNINDLEVEILSSILSMFSI